MTNEQIKQHLDRVVKTAKDIATMTCSQQWENYKKSRVENGERPILTVSANRYHYSA